MTQYYSVKSFLLHLLQQQDGSEKSHLALSPYGWWNAVFYCLSHHEHFLGQPPSPKCLLPTGTTGLRFHCTQGTREWRRGQDQSFGDGELLHRKVVLSWGWGDHLGLSKQDCESDGGENTDCSKNHHTSPERNRENSRQAFNGFPAPVSIPMNWTLFPWACPVHQLSTAV